MSLASLYFAMEVPAEVALIQQGLAAARQGLVEVVLLRQGLVEVVLSRQGLVEVVLSKWIYLAQMSLELPFWRGFSPIAHLH